MQKARAIRIHDKGDVRLDEIAVPDPGPGELLVRLAFSPIHPADLNAIEGKYPGVPATPYVGGREGAGHVEAVGSGVDGVKAGDLVLLPAECWSELSVWKAADVVPVKAALDPAQAALLRINPATAIRMLHDFVDLPPGGWVVQNAGTSAVGRAVAQIARHFGWHTVSLVRDLARVDEDLHAAGDVFLVDDEHAAIPRSAPLHLALNAVGGESALRLANALADCGTLVTYGAMARQPVRIPNGLLIFRDLRFRGFWVSRWWKSASAAEIAGMFETLVDLAAKGVVVSKVEAAVGFADFESALDRAAKGGRGGKILLRP